jgi:hypothetical protein
LARNPSLIATGGKRILGRVLERVRRPDPLIAPVER